VIASGGISFPCGHVGTVECENDEQRNCGKVAMAERPRLEAVEAGWIPISWGSCFRSACVIIRNPSVWDGFFCQMLNLRRWLVFLLLLPSPSSQHPRSDHDSIVATLTPVFDRGSIDYNKQMTPL